jgi:hypothetical protein
MKRCSLLARESPLVPKLRLGTHFAKLCYAAIRESIVDCCTLLVGLFAVTIHSVPVRADAFDRYTNPILIKVPSADGVKEVKQLTGSLLADSDAAIPGISGALVVVRSNEGRFSKLLVHPGRQKIGGKAIPILIIDRYVTYREGEEQTIQASARDVHLFDGFHLNLDVGQIVPPALGGDLRFLADKTVAEPVGKAKLYLVTKPLPGTEPKKGEKLIVADKFEKHYFNGTYKLYDDGRRSGKLVLKVDDSGSVSGAYYSDKDGRKYEVTGKIGSPDYAIQFTIKFPRTEQLFTGWLFTGDAKAITGSSRLERREAGFYALRVEE